MREDKNGSGPVPRLRFQEFLNAGAWSMPTLADISTPVEERVGDRILTPVSISAGIGFVPQAEKFGRDISGNQYRLYTVVRNGDFVYNKGNSLKFPQGCVYDLQDWGEVAAPNVFICFRLKEGYENRFYRQCFEQNLHGAQLRKHITSGARSNGLLNISKEAFFDVQIPTPDQSEQRKIADCLSSLDELIEAEEHKLNALKTNKTALVLELFPQEGKALPRLRFPQFLSDPPWVSTKLSDVATIQSGGTPARTNPAYWGGNIPWVTTSLVDAGIINEAEEFITEAGLKESSAKMFPKGTLLMAMYGQGQTRGKVAILGIAAATNQACAAILLRSKDVSNDFLFQSLNARYKEIRGISNSGGQANLSAGLIENIPLSYPSNKGEQEKISSLLSSFDELVRIQVQRVERLRVCKKGLMQQLFPALNEVDE